MLLFYVLSFFKKGDTIQGGTLLKGGQYLRKYGVYIKQKSDDMIRSHNVMFTKKMKRISKDIFYLPIPDQCNAHTL